MSYATEFLIQMYHLKTKGKKMNIVERELIKMAKKLMYHALLEECEAASLDIKKKQEVTKYYMDVMNTGILVDVNKLKAIGIEKLYSALKKRELKV